MLYCNTPKNLSFGYFGCCFVNSETFQDRRLTEFKNTLIRRPQLFIFVYVGTFLPNWMLGFHWHDDLRSSELAQLFLFQFFCWMVVSTQRTWCIEYRKVLTIYILNNTISAIRDTFLVLCGIAICKSTHTSKTNSLCCTRRKYCCYCTRRKSCTGNKILTTAKNSAAIKKF